MSASVSPIRKAPRSVGRPTIKGRCATTPTPKPGTLEILSNAVDRLEGVARVALVLADWAEDGTKLAAFDELARHVPMEVLVLKAVRDELAAANRQEGITNA